MKRDEAYNKQAILDCLGVVYNHRQTLLKEKKSRCLMPERYYEELELLSSTEDRLKKILNFKVLYRIDNSEWIAFEEGTIENPYDIGGMCIDHEE